MKKPVLFLFSFFIVSVAVAQNPVSWAFSSKKVSANVYELRLTATMQPGWHLYSQNQPADAVAQPTSFVFNSHPLLALDGKVKEVGKLEEFQTCDDKKCLPPKTVPFSIALR
jgi:thiol:disulfide interchange protein DsbD